MSGFETWGLRSAQNPYPSAQLARSKRALAAENAVRVGGRFGSQDQVSRMERAVAENNPQAGGLVLLGRKFPDTLALLEDVAVR